MSLNRNQVFRRKMRPWRFTSSTTRTPSPIVRVIGFSHQMSLPARAASTAISACQCGGVAMWTTSMSGRARISR